MAKRLTAWRPSWPLQGRMRSISQLISVMILYAFSLNMTACTAWEPTVVTVQPDPPVIARRPLPIPPAPGLQGGSVAVQGLAVDAGTGQFVLSNALTLTIGV